MVTLAETEKCSDGGECFLVERGLPRCKGSCSIWYSRFHPNDWEHIKRSASQGNAAAEEVLRRGEHFGR